MVSLLPLCRYAILIRHALGGTISGCRCPVMRKQRCVEFTEQYRNEAFATLMGEVIIIQELHPEWKIHSEFINMHLKRALQLDALRSSHPIEMPCPGTFSISYLSRADDAVL